MAFCALALYLSFPTQTYYWDGVLFSINIESVYRSESSWMTLIHPNHLLYSALGYVLYSAALKIGLHLRAITILQISNAILGAISALAFYFLSKRVARSGSVALFSTVLFAFGANWWKYSTDADAYILCILILLAGSFFLLKDSPQLLPLAVCHAAAMLFHELAVFFYAPVLAAIWLDPQRSTAPRIRSSIAYVFSTGLIVAAIYPLCYVHADRHVYPTLASWILSYDKAHTRFAHSIGEIGPYFAGYVRLFFGGRLTLIRQFVSIPMLLGFGTCFVALVSAINAWRRPQELAGPSVQGHQTRIILWTWLLSYAVFLALWDPGSTFHKLFLWPPLVLLITLYAANCPIPRHRIRSLLAIAIAIAAWNFGAFIYPHSRPGADPVLALAGKVDRESPRNAIVFYAAPNADSWYLRYFAPGRHWIMLPSDQAADRQLIESTKGAVCLDTTAIGPFEHNLRPDSKWNLVNSHHNVKLECRVNTDQ